MKGERELLITGGRIVDGTGAAPYVADVLVIGDRIAEISSDISREPPREIFDAAGCVDER